MSRQTASSRVAATGTSISPSRTTREAPRTAAWTSPSPPPDPTHTRNETQMTINTTVGSTPGADDEKPWQPALTEREARAQGMSPQMYRQLVVLARTANEEGAAKGLPPHLREPGTTQNDLFTSEYIEAGDAELEERLDVDIDPQLDEMRDTLESVKAGLDALDEDTLPVVTPESGETMTNAEAIERVGTSNEKIRVDTRAGRTHHLRTSRALMLVGRIAPWLEAVGLAAFMAFFLNVPLMQPWVDPLGWTFAMAVVVVVILGQTYTVHGSARAHNHAREDEAEGNRHEAEKAYRARNRYLLIAAITATTITGGMIARAIVALGDAELGTLVILVALAVVTGLLMPTLAWLAEARDGSTTSRERDRLVEVLDADLEDDLKTRATVHSELAEVEEVRDHLQTSDFPRTVDSAQRTVDECYFPYNAIRVLIGNLQADPPEKTTPTLTRNETGQIIGGSIKVSIPGARSVDLSPLIDRLDRLAALEKLRQAHHKRFLDTPAHPWAAARKS
ncbi:hypothetical protein GTU73_01845 [Rathayibacter sp. VKM Ac-2804]|uniref:hypothetical protein n=1 Tax=Rathayibacter sp. VKM Ac-2804 TaxID=2609257 RepID=UPI00132F134B|nr:hypothetical protein [Rathayibacter sp. VKM Ac-2804]QHF22869.1 hypothetical protein GTU73_01845 [Rathayibacter sp. VKM Ac-2804]